MPPRPAGPWHRAGAAEPHDPAAGHDLPVGHLLDARRAPRAGPRRRTVERRVHPRGARRPQALRAPRRCCAGVTFGVHRGDVKAVLGPSGIGKSTLLRCLALLEPVDAGRGAPGGQRIGSREGRGGRPVAAVRSGVLARQRSEIGMVFQRFNLFPHLTALGNVMIGLTEVRGQVRGRRRRTSPRRCWPASAWPSGPASTRRSCRAASSSGWPSPGRW